MKEQRQGSTWLRSLTGEDAKAFAAIHRDPLNVEWASSDSTMTLESAAKLISGPIERAAAQGTTIRLAILDDELGAEVAGTLSLQDITRAGDVAVAAVGIKLVGKARGRGIAGRAIDALLRYGFQELGLTLLHWKASVGNQASRRLAENNHFTLVATVPGYGHRSGAITDGWIFTLDKSSWLAGQAAHNQNSTVTDKLELSAGVVHPGETGQTKLAPEPVVPVLSDGKVTLRALSDKDAPALVKNCLDPAAIRWTSVPLNYDLSHADFFINTVVPEGWESRNVLGFAVVDAATDSLLGTIDLQCKTPGTAGIGINMGPTARGTGASESACRLLIDYAYNQLNLSYLHWHALDQNWASRKLAWKLGFTFEGSIRGGISDRGTPHDVWILTRAASDSPEPKGEWAGPENR